MLDGSSPPSLRAMQAEEQGGNSLVTILAVGVIIVAAVGAFLLVRGNGTTEPQEETDDTAQEQQEEEVTPTPEETVEPTEEPEEPTETPTPTEEEEEESTNGGSSSVTVELPSSWKPIEIGGLGYQSYRPSSWFFRRSGNTLGISPNAIPEASETLGEVTITKRSGSLSSVVSDIKSGLSGVTESSVDANDNSWVVIEGTEPAGDLFDERQVKAGAIEASGSIYVLDYRTSPSSFGTNVSVFDTLLGVIEFE